MIAQASGVMASRLTIGLHSLWLIAFVLVIGFFVFKLMLSILLLFRGYKAKGKGTKYGWILGQALVQPAVLPSGGLVVSYRRKHIPRLLDSYNAKPSPHV
jgi:hypothetical protein